MAETYICKFCGRVCDKIRSLRSHQAFCHKNPNRVITGGHRWTKEERKKLGEANKGRITVFKEEKTKFIYPNELNEYQKNGWVKGVSRENVEKIENGFLKNGTIKGRSKTEEGKFLRRQKISDKMKGNTNWLYNKKRGNGKRGWYHGIYCDSAWELAFLAYHIENDLHIKRSTLRLPFMWKGEQHIYIPDFETNDGVIEIKGRKTEKSREKERQFPDIKIIDVIGIRPYLKYVIDKYGKNFTEILYDKK